MRRLSEVATVLVAITGLAVATVGVGMVSLPAALIFAGLTLTASVIGWERGQ